MSVPCGTNGCPKVAHAKGLCDKCYRALFGVQYKPEKKSKVSERPHTHKRIVEDKK
jgi:hypothetical protein